MCLKPFALDGGGTLTPAEATDWVDPISRSSLAKMTPKRSVVDLYSTRLESSSSGSSFLSFSLSLPPHRLSSFFLFLMSSSLFLVDSLTCEIGST